jgi:hypothetical protein
MFKEALINQNNNENNSWRQISSSSTTYNLRVLRSVGALCYHILTQNRIDFIVKRDNAKCMKHKHRI